MSPETITQQAMSLSFCSSSQEPPNPMSAEPGWNCWWHRRRRKGRNRVPYRETCGFGPTNDGLDSNQYSQCE